jgi:UTP--glucose-1-phosphate uridylyltransferase
VAFKAVVPAAGFGSRMLPVTKSVPKEMLPVGRKPVIQHVVEEASAAGIREVCVVIREGKEIIRDYFRSGPPAGHERDESMVELKELVARCELTFILQRRPRGIGDALLEAREFVGGQPFVMMVPDQLLRSDTPATLQLTRAWKPGAAIWTSLVRVPREDVPFFGSSRGFELRGGGDNDDDDDAAPGTAFDVGRILGEEETRAAYAGSPFEVRGFGRTVFPPEIFDYLGEEFASAETGEVDLQKTFAAATRRLAHRGVALEGEPLDLGSFGGYHRALRSHAWEGEGR